MHATDTAALGALGVLVSGGLAVDRSDWAHTMAVVYSFIRVFYRGWLKGRCVVKMYALEDVCEFVLLL